MVTLIGEIVNKIQSNSTIILLAEEQDAVEVKWIWGITHEYSAA